SSRLEFGHALAGFVILYLTNGGVSIMTRKYDRDFKEYIAKLVVDENITQAELSREHDVPSTTIGRWVKNYRLEKAKENGGVQFVTPTEHKQRESELLIQIKELEEENAILKKVAHIFMKDPK
ncbi:transposase, partial [Pseudogracilibacillus sp. SO30301A]|uniref:transposase n=1 Tax=Pseudogracilibacillus sp. SO30301A TaxID=3098291 RepID=UPI00300E12F2